MASTAVVISVLRINDVWVPPCENVASDTYGQRMLRSACTSAHSDQELRCPLTYSLDTITCINGKQMPGWNFAHAWDESESAFCACSKTHFRLTRHICKYLQTIKDYQLIGVVCSMCGVIIVILIIWEVTGPQVITIKELRHDVSIKRNPL